MQYKSIQPFYKIIGISLIALLFHSCKHNVVFEENQEIGLPGWSISKPLTFEVMVEDTLTLNDFYVNIRNNSDYPYSNLYLFIKTILPNHTMAMDTLECILADDTGKWLGKGLGDVKSKQYPFMKQFRFPHAGKYLFVVEQGMRQDPLPGIVDVGISIEISKSE